MKEKLLIAMLVAVATFTEFFPNVSAQDAANKAQQLIAQARAALGSEKLKSLGAEGSYRRSLGSMEMNGEQELEKRMKDAEAEAAQAPDVEFQVRFSDYKSEGGVTLPHRISKGIGSETNEEIEFAKFKINPQIKPEKFTKK